MKIEHYHAVHEINMDTQISLFYHDNYLLKKIKKLISTAGLPAHP